MDIFIGEAKKFVDCITEKSISDKLILRKEFIDQFRQLLMNSHNNKDQSKTDRNKTPGEKISFIFSVGFYRDISHTIGNHVYYFITSCGSIYVIDKKWTYRTGHETLYEFQMIEGYANVKVNFIFGELSRFNVSDCGYIGILR